ncbi:hypothetical protein [Vibrio viridaestus]|uniref:Uncharacterized protein n=1 Tax=Vibrio viridaestus TaxID=2487322 RepID=A0A3N9TEZ4_9VIBR|nr:hypothetical protein [Vibrio viridaestus]RQW62801.1 hypothetical protein EES38_13860 [Vibrio viridaestus]
MTNFYIDDGEQTVRELIADLLERFGKQIESGRVPKVKLHYFGAELEINLLEFEGIGKFHTTTAE